MKIKFVQSLIDLLRGKKKQKKNFSYFKRIHKNIEKNIAKIKFKILAGKKIKIAFLHMYATDCQNLSIFEKMLEDDNIFDPYFIVNPDVLRSRENFDYNYKRSLQELIEKYGCERVLNGYDYAKDVFIDYSSEFDIMTTNNPYDDMAHKYFKIEYWAQKNIPIFYISYFYMGRCFVGIENLKSHAFSYMWKIFAENEFVMKLAKEYEIIRGQNIIISGSPKMDLLSKIDVTNKENIMIIISPHHSIDDNEKSVGGFLQYSNALLKIPPKFKDIDFVFRPHPLLLENLRNKYWGEEKTEDYLKELLSNENVKLSTEGEYMELFAQSDALIHDCGSFCAEYLYTGKPCAYLYKKGINPEAIWTEFGKACIDLHYPINNEFEIEKFINQVVKNGNDYKKDQREEYVKKNIAINYPNCTNFIMNNLMESFK